MQVKMANIDTLKAHPMNPRVHPESAIDKEEEVCRIRYLYDNKLANQVQIAEMFGMSQQEISNIVRRRKWAS